MNISELHAQLQTKHVEHFYIFTGTEWKVQQIYIRQIGKLSGLPVHYVDTFMEVHSALKNSKLIKKDYVYVVRDDKEILSNEKLQLEIDAGLLKNNILILLLTNPDKRTKFFKKYSDHICEFPPLKPDILKRYLQKEINLSVPNCEKLMEVCEYDYGRCLLEIDKIKVFMLDAEEHQYDMDSNEAFEVLLEDGTIYQPPKDAIFDFIPAVLTHKIDSIFELYEQCKSIGESSMVMISVLYDNAKSVLQVQSCSSNDVSKSTGLSAWQIRNAKECCGIYSNRELLNIMELCHKCERGIKTGAMEEIYTIDYILSNIL